jgi:hypothetical protein
MHSSIRSLRIFRKSEYAAFSTPVHCNGSLSFGLAIVCGLGKGCTASVKVKVRCVTCRLAARSCSRSWPNIPQISVFVIKHEPDGKSQILPNICFVDRATGGEAIACLISVATLKLFWSTDISDISKFAAACHLNGVRIRDHLLSVPFTQINGCHMLCTYERSMKSLLDRARDSDAKASILLKNPCSDNLHKLILIFHAPVCLDSRDDFDPERDIDKWIYRALPIDECLQNFDALSIIRLKRLQKVVFIAKTQSTCCAG